VLHALLLPFCVPAGANSSALPDSGFCKTCLCSIQSTLDSIIKQRAALLTAPSSSKGSNSSANDTYRGCYVILTQALVEGDVLTPQAATALGSDQCRSFAQLAPADRKATCQTEAGSRDATAAGGTGNVTAAGPSTTQRSSGGVCGMVGEQTVVMVVLAALVAMWVGWGFSI
jgi:hypothetical protein